MTHGPYLIINSMSRSGTSLLYQLLFGHPEIFFPPFRIQIACSKPLGFPIKDQTSSAEEFLECLSAKTTTPVNISKGTQWSNIEIETLSQQGLKCNEEMIGRSRSEGGSQSSLDKAVDILHASLGMEREISHKYYCLHDDHAYMLGAGLLGSCHGKILTTIRSPLDMLASKKNMLLFHLYKTAAPKDHRMTETALEREMARSIFSWLVASYEYSNAKSYYPVLFEHIKGEYRGQVMTLLMEHLELKYRPCLETDQNELPSDEICNELLYAGSSLQEITKGKSNRTIGSSHFSLTDEEENFIRQRMDVENVNRYISSEPQYFYSHFDSLWKEGLQVDLPVLNKWMDWYISGNHKELFREYSSFNYGFSNAAAAF